MMRYSLVAKLAGQSRYIVNHKKPVVEITGKVLPKYIYETKYHPAKDPGIDYGFPDHDHLNPWCEEAGNRHELFRYKYTGQWWQGQFPSKVFFFFCPVLLGLAIWKNYEYSLSVNEQNYVNQPSSDTIGRIPRI